MLSRTPRLSCTWRLVAVRVTHLPPRCDRAYRRNRDMSVTGPRRNRVVSSTGRIAVCSSSSPTPRASTAARLSLGGIHAAELVAAHGSPLVVYDEATLRANARAYRAAAPDAFVCYGTKAFPNVALLRLLAEEGIGADVSTLGELRFAQAAGIPGDRLVVHGNNKSDDELRAAAEAGALVVRRLARGDRPRPGRRRHAHADPRHARRRGRHARAHPHRPPRLEVRPPARRRARGAPPRARDRGPPRPRRLAAPRHRRRADGRRLARDLRRPRPRRDRLGAAHDRPRRRARRRDLARRAATRDRGVRRARCSASSNAPASCRACPARR